MKMQVWTSYVRILMKYRYSCILLIFNLLIRFQYDRIISEGTKHKQELYKCKICSLHLTYTVLWINLHN